MKSHGLQRGRHASAALGTVLLLASAFGGYAATLKSTMERMAETTKAAKAVLASTDPASADAVMQAYAKEAQAAVALFAGGSPKASDLRARFTTFATTAEGARQSGGTPGGFKAAFGTIVGQCRSCHAVYK